MKKITIEVEDCMYEFLNDIFKKLEKDVMTKNDFYIVLLNLGLENFFDKFNKLVKNEKREVDFEYNLN